ncbi:MAG: ATP phosphoribosyltransferase regulatory subunit [Oscillospiraceae bacterium]|nr:ATP phosphoribosyltransferase regulatory subunit [Oscillospiraceae bacterium]
MKSYDLITPEGTRDLLFEDCSAVTAVENGLQGIFKAKGYSQVMTPGLEFYDVFNMKSRYFPQETLYKLTDAKNRLLVVRPDSTMPIARLAATRLRTQSLPIRLCYSQSVFRSRPGMRGRSDEIRQTGIELIGSSSKRADLEIIANALEALTFCHRSGARLEIGHIGFFKRLVALLGATYDEVEQIRSLIEVKNYPVLNDVLDSFGDNRAAKTLKLLPRLFGGEEVFESAAVLYEDDELKQVLEELRDIYSQACRLGFDVEITIDLGLVNRMDYYTGTVIKGYIAGCADAVISGGRYDGLLNEFGYDVPAAGFAVNVNAAAESYKKHCGCELSPCEVLVFGEQGCEAKALNLCRKLCESGVTAENSVAETIEEARAYAVEKGISRIEIVSDNSVTEE